MKNQTIQLLKNSKHLPLTHFNLSVLKILEKEGFLTISSIFSENSSLFISFKYSLSEDNSLSILPISKSSRKLYSGYKPMTKGVKHGLGMAVLSTTLGFITDRKSVNKRTGGLLLFKTQFKPYTHSLL